MDSNTPDKTVRRNAERDHPYDHILQRIISDMSSLLIPLANVLFGTAFPMDAQITVHPRELIMRSDDGGITERVVDSLFSIRHRDVRHLFHIEFETSPRLAIRIRLVDYRFGIASSLLGKPGDDSAWILPESGIVCLRTTLAGKPDYLHETYELPGVVSYEDNGVVHHKPRGPLRVTVGNPVIYMEDYQADRLIDGNLALLMPFLLFAYLKNPGALRTDPSHGHILNEFQKVADYYVREAQKPDGILTTAQAAILSELTTIATEYLGQEIPGLVEGVKKIMYVEPIETEITKLRDENIRNVAKLADTEAVLEDTKAKLEDTKAKLEDSNSKLEDSMARIAELEQLVRTLSGSAPSAQLS